MSLIFMETHVSLFFSKMASNFTTDKETYTTEARTAAATKTTTTEINNISTSN